MSVIDSGIVRQIASAVFLALLPSGGKALAQLSETLQQKIYLASRQYSQSYIERHGILKVLGMREPIPLESVYIAVQLLDNRTIQNFETIEVLEDVYRRAHQRGFQSKDDQRYSGLDIANQKQYLMVLGHPGAGKSTFLRKVGLEALRGKQKEGFQHNCIPVFIELKRFRSEPINFEEAIAEIFRIRGFPEPYHFTLKALERGELLILLDGLDEVSDDLMAELIIKIQNFVDLHDKNRFITSCRLAAYRYNFRRFTDVIIADFSENQIENFIASWFSEEPEKGQECWHKLINSKYASAKELTHTPLLLTLICLLYKRAGQFPTNRSTLYEKALRVLLEEWAGEKGIVQESLYTGLDTKRKEIMLAEIAYRAFQEDRLFLYQRELIHQIESLLKEMLPEEKYINGKAVLKSIEIQHGLLVERAEGIYSFSHLTFQEFLTAQHIIDDQHRVEDLITHHLINKRWQEVFLLLAGLKQADELLLKMCDKMTLYTQNSTLSTLLIWADQVTISSEGANKALAKRAVAIFMGISIIRSVTANILHAKSLHLSINYAQEIAFEIDPSFASNNFFDVIAIHLFSIDFIIEIMTNIYLQEIFWGIDFNALIARLKVLKVKYDYHNTQHNKITINKKVTDLLLDMFMLKQPLIVDLTYETVEAINQYFYITILILRCRKAAVRVSLETWSSIETNILTSRSQNLT